MPVSNLQRRDDQLRHVVVQRTGPNEKDEVHHVKTMPDSTVSISDQIPNVAHDRSRLQPTPTFVVVKRDGDDFEDGGHASTMRSMMTMDQPTLVARQSTQSSVGATSRPMMPHRPHKQMSQTTQHLLIAAGSIGVTIVVIMIMFAVYTSRKRGMTFAEVVKQGRYQVTHRGPPPPPKTPVNDFDNKQGYWNPWNGALAPSKSGLGGSGSIPSQKPPPALQRGDSYRQVASQRLDTEPQSFFLQSPPRRKRSDPRTDSMTPSPQPLGQEAARGNGVTHNTRSMYGTSSPQMYPAGTSQGQAQNPQPPPPTFKQFLNDRPSTSGKNAGMASRFSWTNSNAPQTPHDPSRDTVNYQDSRESFVTTRSSVPRFRTVDSWVNQQTNRVEEQKLREQLNMTRTPTESSGDGTDERIPEVPAIPDNVQQLRDNSTTLTNSLPSRMPDAPLPLKIKRLSGKKARHRRHDTVETAPIFRQHPGTEVRFSIKSAVPSEILDMGKRRDILS